MAPRRRKADATDDALSEDTKANREIIRQAFDACRDGTGSITDVFAPEMAWRLAGLTGR